MRLLRPHARYTLLDHIQNEDKCIIDKIQRYRINWLENVERMDVTEFKMIMEI